MTQELVYVRGTVTSSEQVLAGAIGLVTAGPLGAFASAVTLKGMQGKWGPWTMAGVVGVPVCWLVQAMALSGLGALGLIGGATAESLLQQSTPKPEQEAQRTEALRVVEQVAPKPPTAEPTTTQLDGYTPPAPSPSLVGLFADDPFIEEGMK